MYKRQGIASKPGDLDNLEELMTPSDEELEFWSKQNVDSQYMIKDRFDNSSKSLDSKGVNVSEIEDAF